MNTKRVTDLDYSRAKMDAVVKGLRPVLEGFVVIMHEGACVTGSQIPRALARGLFLLKWIDFNSSMDT